MNIVIQFIKAAFHLCEKAFLVQRRILVQELSVAYPLISYRTGTGIGNWLTLELYPAY
jgi:hypothetical protein